MQELQNYIASEYCGGITLYGQGEAEDALFSSFRDGIKPALSSALILFGLIITAALVKHFVSAVSDSTGATDLCAALLCSIAAFEVLRRAYDAVQASLSAVAILMDTMSAAMCAMYGLTGNIVGGSSSASTLMLALQITRLLSDKILFPLSLILFGVSLISVFGFDAGMKHISKTVKRATVFLCTAAGAVLCAVLSYQTVIAKAADGAAIKAVKFASSSFIPIIGSSLSESVTAVTTSIAAVRGAAGAGGVISLLVIVIPAVLSVVLSKLCMRASSALCAFLEADALQTFFDECNDVLSVLLSVILTVSVVFSAACALFCI
ncbi:MAG: hypothetical protein IKQ18_01805 [Clostridia bacterium]|nr:hypothetical protein [Clostridia bacterium]